MVTSVLHDSLKRSFNVMPAKCVFGKIKAGKTYELVITLKNEDNLSQRICKQRFIVFAIYKFLIL
jgi:hypothetical protein